MAPRVSVIIPNYNHAKYLPKRVESVLNQTFNDFELIVLDDKSTDNSREVIERYRSNRLVKQVVYNETNSGSSFAQWNKGIELANGEYIWLAESDDIAENNFLEKTMGVLDAHPNVALVYTQSFDMDENGNISGSWLKLTERLDSQKWKQDFIASGAEEVKKYMVYQNIIPNASAVLFRKTAWQKAGAPDATYKLNGDWNFWIKILLSSDVAYIAEGLNYFRTHKQNVRSKAISQGLNYFEYARILDYIFKSLPFTAAEKRKAISYFNDEMNYSAPITFNNLVKSFMLLFKYDLISLKFMARQIKVRYL